MVAAREVRIRTKPIGRGVRDGDRAASFIKLAHWAIEIVGVNSRDGNMLVELSAIGIISKAERTFGREFRLFFPAGDVPDELKSDFAGTTSLDDDAIKKIADEIISTQALYGPIGENCQRFATILACRIITSPTEKLQQRLADELGEKILAKFFPAYVVWKGVRDAWNGTQQWFKGLFS